MFCMQLDLAKKAKQQLQEKTAGKDCFFTLSGTSWTLQTYFSNCPEEVALVSFKQLAQGLNVLSEHLELT